MNASDTAAPFPPHRPWRSVFDLPAWGLAGVSLAGFMGGWHWLLDLASHFRWYWLLFALVWFALAAWRGTRLAVACLAFTVMANAWVILPYWLPAPVEPAVGDPLTIVSINLHVDNHDRGPTLAHLRHRAPDVIVCLEVDNAWADALGDLETLYPFRVVEPRRDQFGIAVFSRVPLEDARVMELGGGSPLVIARVARGVDGCLLVACHPLAPISAEWAARRDAQLAAIGELAASVPYPVIVVGDFNATPWSHAFRAVTGPRGLRDTALGRGIHTTWNARLWAPRIPIDHVIVSPEIGVRDRGQGPDVGSDHLPIEVTLVVP